MQYCDITLSLFNISRAEYNPGRYIFNSHQRSLNAGSFIYTRDTLFSSPGKILYTIYTIMDLFCLIFYSNIYHPLSAMLRSLKKFVIV